jgi:curved DNA-binding protein CbpA
MTKSHDKYVVDVETDEKMTYYQILGVNESASLADIKKQFRKLVIDFHPDNKKTGDATIFALVAKAYEYLSDSEKRDDYDKMLLIEKKTKKNIYINQKKAFDEFLKAQENDPTGKKKELSEATFKLQFTESDKKRQFDRQQYEHEKENKISNKESSKRLEDLLMARETDEIEYTQRRLFNDGIFDNDRFNELFENKYRTKNQLAKRAETPSAFNLGGQSGFNFNEEDEQEYGELFGGAEDTKEYSSVGNFDENDIEITDEDVRRLKSMKGSKDFKGHNADRSSKSYQSELEKRLKEREDEDKGYESRKMGDFETDKKMGGYGFLHEVGLSGKELDWEEDEIDERAVRKLLEMRKRKSKR